MSKYTGRTTPSALAAVADEQGRWLMIQRTREPYIGRWALPGGKVETGEHPDAAAVREFCEETGFAAEVTRFAGTVSERLVEADGVSHFLLYVFQLRITGGTLQETPEGPLAWLPLADIQAHGIASDLWIVSNLLLPAVAEPRYAALTAHDGEVRVDFPRQPLPTVLT